MEKTMQNTSKNLSKKIADDNLDKSMDTTSSVPLKTFQGQSFKGKRKNFLNKERIRLQRLQKGKEIINNITKRLKKRDSLFMTDYNGQNSQSNNEIFKNHIPRIKLQSNVKIIKDYNVFETEDEFIGRIMSKFYINEGKKKPTKMEKRKTALNKIYGFTPYFSRSMRKAKLQKSLPLEEYQNHILNTFAINAKNIEQGRFIDLIQNMKDLRAETESISPLPKINIKMIKKHVESRGTKNLRQMSIKEYLKKEREPMDEFEKENMMITKMKTQRYVNHTMRSRRNKNLDNLPQHLRDVFNNQIKYHG